MGQAVAAEGCLKMKELTYIHCQSVSMANISNDFYTYSKQQHVPAIFILLDSGDPREKAIMIEGMDKLKKADVKMTPIVISDCQDASTLEFLSAFTPHTYFVPKSGPALSPLLCVVPL